jgi:hypothetical protein
MSPRRFALELSVFLCAAIGAAIGYRAGHNMEPTVQMILAFLGMAVGGAFTDYCLRGENR